ncbi:MAG TPA: DUF3280 domain-containing protein [Burkholderiales bacterium]|nr:DUF3280 domain-containing protein [Burkholderiales bacterium]
MKMKRWLLMGCMLLAAGAARGETSLLVVNFELVDEMHDPRTAEADAARIERSGPMLREALGGCTAVRVFGPEKAEEAIRRAAKQNAYLYRCNGCAQDIGTAAGADAVMFTWAQKVSNLILNLNAEARDSRSGAVAFARSVDLRGDTDRSWARGIAALAARICKAASRRAASR